jgi:hypothetical protein
MYRCIGISTRDISGKNYLAIGTLEKSITICIDRDISITIDRDICLLSIDIYISICIDRDISIDIDILLFIVMYNYR